jgi:hypothetical protein
MTTPTDPFPTNPTNAFSPFLSTTYNIPEEDDSIKNFLNDTFSRFADLINDKKIGTVVQADENFSGGKWFYKTTKIIRNEYQTIAYIPSWIPQTLTLTSTPQFPIQDINVEFVITQVYGSASLPPSATGVGDGDYFSFYGAGNPRIQFTMSDTKIVISTDGSTEAYSGFIVITYIRNGI